MGEDIITSWLAIGFTFGLLTNIFGFNYGSFIAQTCIYCGLFSGALSSISKTSTRIFYNDLSLILLMSSLGYYISLVPSYLLSVF